MEAKLRLVKKDEAPKKKPKAKTKGKPKPCDYKLFMALTRNRESPACPHGLAINSELLALHDRAKGVSRRIVNAWPLEANTEHLSAFIREIDGAFSDNFMAASAASLAYSESILRVERVAELLEKFLDQMREGLINGTAPERRKEGGCGR